MKKRTVTGMLDDAAKSWPSAPYALKKGAEGYRASSFAEMRGMAIAFSAWLLSSGLEPGDKVAIFGEGSPEWVACEYGLFYAGMVSVPLSIKLTPDEVFFRLDHSESKIIVTTHNYLETALGALAGRSGTAISILYLDEDAEWGNAKVAEAGLEEGRFTTFSKAAAEGWAALAEPSGYLAARLEAIGESITEDTVATISYTSGTTSNPKGVMLTHLNFWTNSHDVSLSFDTPRFKILLILPADHAFTHVCAIFAALWTCVALYFIDGRGGGIAMLRNIPVNIQECQPTFLFTVPILSSSFMKRITAGVEQKGRLTARFFRSGIESAAGWIGDGWHKPPLKKRIAAFFPYFLARTLLFGTVRRKAFGRSIVFLMSGGSKLDLGQQEFFAALGAPLLAGYGLTEAAPVISANTPDCHKFGTMGRLFPSVRCAIMDEDGRELPSGQVGEITVTGDNVMKGYYRNPEATAVALRDGRLWTGDLGFMDKDGFLIVVGRKHALLVSESGEKYSPETIEEAIAASTGVIEQVMAWCVYKKHPCVLVTLDVARIKTLIAKKHIGNAETLCRALQEEFFRFKSNPGVQPIQANWVPMTFQIIGRQFSEKDGTINSVMKLVRHRVEAEYRELIDYSYTKEGSTTMNPKNIGTLASLFDL